MNTDEIREIAKDATVYVLPSVMQYRTMWLQALDPDVGRASSGWGTGWRAIRRGPEDKDIVGASRDTPYLYALAGPASLAEPWVVTVPADHAGGRLLGEPVERHERSRRRRTLPRRWRMAGPAGSSGGAAAGLETATCPPGVGSGCCAARRRSSAASPGSR